MAPRSSALRVVAITAVLASVLAAIAIWRYHPAVHRKVLLALVLLAAVPLGAALGVVDRLVFRSRGLSGLPEIARVGLVIVAGIALSAGVMGVGYLLAEWAALNEAAP